MYEDFRVALSTTGIKELSEVRVLRKSRINTRGHKSGYIAFNFRLIYTTQQVLENYNL